MLLHYFDRTSMAHSLEVRVPFLDHRFVERCAEIPASLKVRRLQTKYVLKRAAADIVPERIINKRKIGFLRGATQGWLQAQLRDNASELLFGSEARCAEFLEREQVARLASGHGGDGATSDAHLLTAVLMLEVWLRTYLPRALKPPGTFHERATGSPMSAAGLTYALVTPVQDEEANLGLVGYVIERQTLKPEVWVIVDTGSTDGTVALASQLAERMPFIRLIAIDGPDRPTRGAPIVRAFTAGVRALETSPDVVVKLDADLSFDPDYFERLIGAFADDARLGMTGGVCTELRNGEWRPLYGTRSHIWGASRAYRWRCLQEVLPLEERRGWDEIDAIKAQIRGWRGAHAPRPLVPTPPSGGTARARAIAEALVQDRRRGAFHGLPVVLPRRSCVLARPSGSTSDRDGRRLPRRQHHATAAVSGLRGEGTPAPGAERAMVAAAASRGNRQGD